MRDESDDDELMDAVFLELQTQVGVVQIRWSTNAPLRECRPAAARTRNESRHRPCISPRTHRTAARFRRLDSDRPKWPLANLPDPYGWIVPWSRQGQRT